MEVFHNGLWGTICHDHWTVDDANVVCRQLGYARAIASPDYSAFGPGGGQVSTHTQALTPSPTHPYYISHTTPHTYVHTLTHTQIWLTNVECVGTESSIFQCPHSDWGDISSSCSHSTDAGVICTSTPINPYPVRLVGGERDLRYAYHNYMYRIAGNFHGCKMFMKSICTCSTSEIIVMSLFVHVEVWLAVSNISRRGKQSSWFEIGVKS